ncbi:MAG: hypothetical protein ACI3XL_02050 [Eubacteriales bacterium]
MKKILKSLVMITVMALVLTAFTACELDLESIKDKVQSIIGGEEPACVHEIVTDEAVDPTCTETGLTEGYHCGKCGEVILKQFTVKALGHKKGTEATCTEAAVCSVCGEHYGDPAGHDFADATCSAPATCTVCGATEGEVNPDNHSFTDATCTEGQICVDCGAEGEPALGHTWVDATCTTPKTCSVCGETEGEALGHTFVEFVTVLPTAEVPGYTMGVCSVEGCEGHKFDEVKAMGDGTYVLDQEGVAHLTASGMAYDGQVVVLNDVFAAHLSGKYRTDGGQNKEFDDGFLGTSRMNWGGGTAFEVEGVKLIRNGIEFTTLNETTVVIHWICGGNDRQVALYDMEGNVVVQSEGATVKNGLYVSEFVVPAGSYVLGNVGGSNYYFGVSVTVAPHVHSYTETVTAPTCTEAGYTTHECTCGDKYTDTPVDALGHDYVDGYCTRCQAVDPDYYFTVSIPEVHESENDRKVIVSGVVASVDTAWSTTYNNMSVTIKDSEGNTLYIFRLATQVAVGDTITVKGVVGYYGGSKQIAAGATATIDVAHGDNHTYSEATCTKPATCTICGAAKDDVLAEHNYVDGVCTGCGLQEGVQLETESLAVAANAGVLSTDKKSISWTATSFSLLNEQNTSTTAIRVSDTDHFRVYQNNKTTISGSKMTKIVISCPSASYADVCKASVTTEGVTVTVEGTLVVITVDSGTIDELVFVATAQWRLSNVEVTYQK